MDCGNADLIIRVLDDDRDEPAAFGGNDTGLSPYELLSAALGTCTAMTLRMYADRKGLPLERASVIVEHQKIHAADCADCETREGKVDRLRREVTPKGETQRRAARESARDR
jgi:putative redox protein